MSFQPSPLEVAESGLEAAFEFVRRTLRVNIDGTRGGVAPADRPLRSTEHFHPLDVENVGIKKPEAAVRHPILAQGGPRFVGDSAERGADATNVDLRIRAFRRRRLHAGRDLLQ